MERKVIKTSIGNHIQVNRLEIDISELVDWILKRESEGAQYLEIYATYDWDDIEIDICAYKKHQESIEEAETRIKREEEYRQKQVLIKEANERAEYDRLKRKFESYGK